VVKDRGTLPEGSIDWEALSNPANYLGEAEKILDSVLLRAKELLSK
jgi:hypothetical protein